MDAHNRSLEAQNGTSVNQYLVAETPHIDEKQDPDWHYCESPIRIRLCSSEKLDPGSALKVMLIRNPVFICVRYYYMYDVCRSILVKVSSDIVSLLSYHLPESILIC